MTTPYYTPPNNGQSMFSANPAHYKPRGQPATPTPVGRGRPRGSATGAKRGRKPRGASAAGALSPRPFVTNTFNAASTSSTTTPASFGTPNANAQYPRVHWAMPGSSSGEGEEGAGSSTSMGGPSGNGSGGTFGTEETTSTSAVQGDQSASTPVQNQDAVMTSASVIDPALMGAGGIVGSQRGTPIPDITAGLILPSGSLAQPPPTSGRSGTLGVDEEAEADDELLPAMADDDYSAQLSWQSHSKDNLKVLMDNLSPAQYDRFEAYRRHALPKQAVRKVIQQTLGQQVSQPVAQIIAGFSKVFVGEIVEKARAVQTRRGESGPLSPDHLREAYRAYQEETGHVGAARPLRAKKLFVR